MDLTPHVEELRQQLLVAAASGGDEARAAAERIVAPLDATTRLVLLDALTAAAAEITRDLAPGSVEVRLRGRDPEFVVSLPAPSPEPAAVDPHGAGASGRAPTPPLAVTTVATVAADTDESATSRLTLRLPEPLKVRLEDAAARDGMSVNSWLVRTVTAALDPRDPPTTRRSATGAHHVTGWAR